MKENLPLQRRIGTFSDWLEIAFFGGMLLAISTILGFVTSNFIEFCHLGKVKPDLQSNTDKVAWLIDVMRRFLFGFKCLAAALSSSVLYENSPDSCTNPNTILPSPVSRIS